MLHSLLAEKVKTEESSVKKKLNCENLMTLGGHNGIHLTQRGPHAKKV